MRYSLTLSFFVLCLVVGTNIVNTLSSGYFFETGRPLLGYVTGTDTVAYNRTISALSQYNENNINGTVYGYINPSQQPAGTGVFVWVDQWIKSLTGIGVVFSTIFYLTVGFGQYINNMFYMPLGGHVLLNDIWCSVIGIMLMINHFLAIWGNIRGVPVGD